MSDIDHRRLGVDLYNATWELLDRDDRSVEDDDAMIAQAHASFHTGARSRRSAPPTSAAARQVCASITDAEDREVVEADLATLPRRP